MARDTSFLQESLRTALAHLFFLNGRHDNDDRITFFVLLRYLFLGPSLYALFMRVLYQNVGYFKFFHDRPTALPETSLLSCLGRSSSRLPFLCRRPFFFLQLAVLSPFPFLQTFLRRLRNLCSLLTTHLPTLTVRTEVPSVSRCVESFRGVVCLLRLPCPRQ